MTIRWFFLNGPLDGLSLDGDADETAGNPLDLAAHAYRESLHGFPGATFDAFLPPVFGTSGSAEATLRLHEYRVTSSLPYRVPAGNFLVPVLVEICASYVGPTDRVITFKVDRQPGRDAVTVRRQCSATTPAQLPRTAQ